MEFNEKRKLDSLTVLAADYIIRYLKEFNNKVKDANDLNQPSGYFVELPKNVYVFQILPPIVGEENAEDVFNNLIREEMIDLTSKRNGIDYYSIPKSYYKEL